MLLTVGFSSFEKGEIFVVNNVMGDGWLWVQSQRTGEEGQVYEELVEDLVSTHALGAGAGTSRHLGSSICS